MPRSAAARRCGLVERGDEEEATQLHDWNGDAMDKQTDRPIDGAAVRRAASTARKNATAQLQPRQRADLLTAYHRPQPLLAVVVLRCGGISSTLDALDRAQLSGQAVSRGSLTE